MMTSDQVKPTVPLVAPLLRAYYQIEGNEAGGNFHLVLENKNVGDANVLYCLERAREQGDVAGTELGSLLLQMSKTQRLKLANLTGQSEAESSRAIQRP